MSPRLSKLKLFVFYLLALAIPLLSLAALEAGLRYFDYGDDLSLFVPTPREMTNDEYMTINSSVALRYFPKKAYFPQPGNDMFLKTKPKNGYRVFVLGESTTVGWPYPNNVMFSRILEQRLADAFPDKHIEIINTGIAAVGTFTLIDFLDEVLAQQPDAILIYAGHNEFYGALGAASSESVGQARWLIKAYLRLMKFKTAQMIRDGVNNVSAQLKGSPDKGHPTLMGRMVGNKSIAYGSETYQAAKANYEANLRELFTRAKTANVPVLISELVSNVRDQRPFISTDDGEHLPADIAYAWAQQLEQSQMFDLARETYAWAKDLDGLRFRASEEFNDVIHKVAGEFSVPVIPMKRYFENASPHGIVGKNLMLEHLHPNSTGYTLMSEAFFDGMRNNAFISKTWDDKIPTHDAYRQRLPITEIDKSLGEIRIINLTDHWPYPPKMPDEPSIANFAPKNEAEALAMKSFKGDISYADAHLRMAQYYDSKGLIDLAMREYMALISSAPYYNDYYLVAVNYLLSKQQLEGAMQLLNRSVRIKKTGFADKWLGQLYLAQNDIKTAQPILERAQRSYPDDPQLIYNLGASYVITGQLDIAKLKLELLVKNTPQSPFIARLRDLIEKGPPPEPTASKQPHDNKSKMTH